MKIINLSHPLVSGMPVFPGTRPVEIRDVNRIESDGYRQKHLSLSSHVGTHVDAPAHILTDGAFLDALPLEQFYGRALVLDVSTAPQLPIPPGVLKGLDTRRLDFVLFYSNWQRHWEKESTYFSNDAPYLSEALAKALTDRGLKGVGLDAPSADALNSRELPVHRILFGKGMIIIENLINLKALCAKEFMLSVFPLPVPRGDGSPVRAVAIIDT